MLETFLAGLLALGIIAGLIYLMYKSAQKKKPTNNQTQPNQANGAKASPPKKNSGSIFDWFWPIIIIVTVLLFFRNCSDGNANEMKFNTFSMEIGDELEIKVDPNEEIRVDFARGQKCSITSKGRLLSIDDKGTERLIEKQNFISGPKPQKFSEFYLYKNLSKKSVTLKIVILNNIVTINTKQNGPTKGPFFYLNLYYFFDSIATK